MMKATGTQGRIELSIGDQPFAVINDRAFEERAAGSHRTLGARRQAADAAA